MLQRHDRARDAALFACASALVLAYLFRAAFHGAVLGQADFLFRYLPWSSHAPVGWRIKNPLMGDIPMQFYPWARFARSEVLAGRFPLWNSAAAAGQPFFAAFQPALLSPFAVLLYVLPFPESLTFIAAARLLIGGVGMFLFLRRIGLSRAAAAFGGMAYLLNPFSIVWLEHPHSAVAAWLPWLLLTADWCATDPGRRAAGATAIVTAAAILSGHPETLLKVLLFVTAYAIFRAGSTRHVLRGTGAFAFAIALGFLLASVQLIPFFEYAQHSRALTLRGDASGPLMANPIASFVTGFVPDFYGSPTKRGYVLGATNYCEQQLYPGIICWALASVAFLHRRLRGLAVFMLGAAAVAAAIMYGTVVARLAMIAFPPLRITLLSRFGLLVIAAVTIAAAVGVDVLLADSRAEARWQRARPALVVFAASVAIAVTIWLFWRAERQLLVDSRQAVHTLRAIALAIELLIALLVVAVAAHALPSRATAALAIAVLVFDLVGFAAGFHALIPRPLVFPPLPELHAAEQDKTIYRVGGVVDVLLPNTAMAYGFQDFRGNDAVGVRSYSELLDAGFHYTGITHQIVGGAALPLIDLLGIKYVFAPPDADLPRDHFAPVAIGPTTIYLNATAQPRAFLADRTAILEGPGALKAMRSGSVDLRHVAIIERAMENGAAPEPAPAGVGDAIVRRYDRERVVIETRADGRRLLVLTDAFFPGWQATLDGKAVFIHRVDYAFRGVALPPGRNLVEFRYRPASFRAGALLSLMTVPLVAWTLMRRRT